LQCFLAMPDALKPAVTAPTKRRSPLLVLGVAVGSIVTLYLLLVLVGGMGWDGY
jgi:hypothetical protein